MDDLEIRQEQIVLPPPPAPFFPPVSQEVILDKEKPTLEELYARESTRPVIEHFHTILSDYRKHMIDSPNKEATRTTFRSIVDKVYHRSIRMLEGAAFPPDSNPKLDLHTKLLIGIGLIYTERDQILHDFDTKEQNPDTERLFRETKQERVRIMLERYHKGRLAVTDEVDRPLPTAVDTLFPAPALQEEDKLVA